MKIKVRYINKNIKPLTFIEKGEWVDLRSADTYILKEPYANTLSKNREVRNVVFDHCLIGLGVAMQLPKYFEAHIVPRSSTFKHWGIIQSNSTGIIDSTYKGNNDEWKLPVIAFANTTINFNDAICQFRIMPSQKAPIWVKLKWLFTNKIKFVSVNTLSDKDRGGFGTTGKN